MPHPNCPGGTPNSPAGPNWFTETLQSHSLVVYDPYKPQIHTAVLLSFEAT